MSVIAASSFQTKISSGGFRKKKTWNKQKKEQTQLEMRERKKCKIYKRRIIKMIKDLNANEKNEPFALQMRSPFGIYTNGKKMLFAA